MNIEWAKPHEIEDGISAVWGIKDIVDTLIWRCVDHPIPMDENQMHNHLPCPQLAAWQALCRCQNPLQP